MKKINLHSLLVMSALALVSMPPTLHAGLGQGNDNNTKNGRDALHNNTTGTDNSAYGVESMYNNTIGTDNSAVGFQSLYSNTIGANNNAFGSQVLFSNIDGIRNVGVGNAALFNLSTGDSNTAVGGSALSSSGTVNFNTALGRRALFRCQADQNTGLGFFAGSNLRDGGTNNIYIGNVGPVPIGTESNTIRLGTQTATIATIGNPPVESHPMPAHTDTYIAGIFGSATSGGISVFVDANGKLGTVPSSQRFKDQIKPMDNASEAILSLQPVTFRYKKEIDPQSVPQFGLIAEQVAKVNPDLVARDAKGNLYTVRYDAVNAMLLNEFLKQHRQMQEQQKQIDKLTAQLKAQAELIQKVNDKIELSRPAPLVVTHDQ